MPILSEYGAYMYLMFFGGIVNFGAYAAFLAYVDSSHLFLAAAVGSITAMGSNFILSRKLVFKSSSSSAE